MNNTESTDRVFGLDLLRAFSIICVLVSHGGGFYLREYNFLLTPVTMFGFIGVECFFVLSGYLIGTIAYRICSNNISLSVIKIFWIRRWFRTIPNYLLFLIINIIFIFYGFFSNPFKSELTNLKGIVSHLFFLQNFSSYKSYQFFAESWSLAIEEWFYISIMLLTFIIHKLLKFSAKSSFYITTTILLICPLLLRTYFTFQNNLTWLEINRTVLLHVDSIAWGVLGAVVYDKVKFNSRNLNLLSASGFCLFFYCLFLFYRNFNTNLLDISTFSRTIYFSLVSLSVSLLIPFFIRITCTKILFKNIITKTSLWSYSIYLTNLPVFYILDSAAIKSPTLNTLLFFSTTFLISAFIFKYFEKPMTDLRRFFSS